MAKRNRRTIRKTCPHCGVMFMGTHKAVNCSRSCSASSRVGEKNSHWKGGITTRGSDGRVFVKHQGRYVLRYRLIAAQMLGRPLREDEIVHHIDGNSSNDVPSNLSVMRQSEHALEHYDHETKRFVSIATKRTKAQIAEGAGEYWPVVTTPEEALRWVREESNR